MSPLSIQLRYDTHHQVAGVALPEGVSSTLWSPVGGLGLKGARATQVPSYMERVRHADWSALLVAATRDQGEALAQEVHRLAGRSLNQAIVSPSGVGLILPAAAADALEGLRKRWVRGDMAVLPAIGNEPPTWAIASRVRPQVRAALLGTQRAHIRLSKAAQKTGIEAELEAAGRRVVALIPAWEDPQNERGLVFRITPQDLRRAVPGVYRAAELREWIHGKGPVVLDPALAAEVARHEGVEHNVMTRLAQANLAVLRARPVWVGTGAYRTLGYHLVPAPGHEARLPEGDYSLKGLYQRFPLVPPPPDALTELRQRLRRSHA